MITIRPARRSFILRMEDCQSSWWQSRRGSPLSSLRSSSSSSSSKCVFIFSQVEGILISWQYFTLSLWSTFSSPSSLSCSPLTSSSSSWSGGQVNWPDSLEQGGSWRDIWKQTIAWWRWAWGDHNHDDEDDHDHHVDLKVRIDYKGQQFYGESGKEIQGLLVESK